MKNFTIITLLFFCTQTLESQETDSIGVERIATEEVKAQSPNLPYAEIEEVPIYPGCEDMVEKDRRSCLNKNVQEHVAKKFKIRIAKKLNLSKGKHRIYVQFLINKSGNIEQIKVRAPHKKLENEAIRVVKSFPQMAPGKQRGTAVGVRYTLPITFGIE